MSPRDEATDVMEHRTVPWRDVRAHGFVRPPERDVSITAVETMALAGNFVWGIVKVETDAGHYGIGEVYSGRVTAALELAETMGAYLVGDNPHDVNALVDTLARNFADVGGGPAGAAARTGIETALWDLKGKVADLPLYELFGGTYRREVKLYCDAHAGDALEREADADPRDLYTPDAYASAAREIVDEGFDALKFDLDVVLPGHSHVDAPAGRMGAREIAHKVSLVEAVREAVGPDVDLGVDLHWNYTVETAVRLGRRLEPYGLAWLEDPVPPRKTEAHRRVRERLAVPVLTGENLDSAGEFDKLLVAGALDLAAPDVAKCGGLGEFRRIAAICDVYGVPLVPHNIASPVGTVAGVHACASIPNAVAMEFHARDVDWWADLVSRTDGDGPVVEDGAVPLPNGPGLGIEIDPDVAARHLLPGYDVVV